MMIDTEALKDYVGRNGPWAIESGRRAKTFRLRLTADGKEPTPGDVGSVRWLADGVGVSTTSIVEIEAGRIVPRDYLRAAIAFMVGVDSETIWPPITRQRTHEIAQVA